MAKARTSNDAAERMVLGMVLRDALLYWRLRDRLKPNLFFNGRHQRIVRILHKIADANRPFEFSTITGHMPEEPGFDPAAYLYVVTEEASGDPGDVFDVLGDLEEMLAARQMQNLGQSLITAASDDTGLSARERLAKAIKDIEEIGDALGSQAEPVGVVAERMLAGVYDTFSSQAVVGLQGGLVASDNLTGKFMPGRVYVVAGPPGSGKSAWGWKAGMNFARTVPGCFFSQEMDPEELTGRDVAQRTGIPAFRIESASLNAGEVDAVSDAVRDMASLKLYLDGETGLNHHQIRNRLYRLQRTVGCKFGIIDHLLYCGKTEKRQSTLDAIGENMKGFKATAKALAIPIIILAQLKMEYGKGDWSEIRTPQVGDIYGGSMVEHDADVILFVHRPEVLLERKKPPATVNEDVKARWEAQVEKWKGLAEFSLGKRRGGKGNGSATCFFDGPTMAFSDMAPAQKRKPIDDVDNFI